MAGQNESHHLFIGCRSLHSYDWRVTRRHEVAHVPVHHCHSVADALGSGTARVLCWSTMPDYFVWQVRFALPCIGDSKDVVAY